MFEAQVDREQVFTVTEINRHVKHVIESNIPQIMVEGEIANFVRHSSGHMYFSLKDAESTLRCVFFRPQNATLTFTPRDGDKVICVGRLSVFEKSGSYQVTVSRCVLSGAGIVQAQLEELKQKLAEEGLFDDERKRPMPLFPQAVGVITSPTGAAFQDICKVIRRRWPCEIWLFPASVQGEKAVPEILDGLDYFARNGGIDVLIVGRGGGSQEDLWAFNDERLARAVAAANVPVISAVGHEIDFTLIDFVADLRAPTPSAAAEMAVPDRRDVSMRLLELGRNLADMVQMVLHTHRNRLLRTEMDLQPLHPERQLREDQQRLDEAVLSLRHSLQRFGEYRRDTQTWAIRLQSAVRHAAWHSQAVMSARLRDGESGLKNAVDHCLDSLHERLQSGREHLSAYSPRDALQRGYAILRQNRKMIRSIQEIDPDTVLDIHLKDGTCQCSVSSIDSSSPFAS